MSLADEQFKQFRVADADGGVVRSYAHLWFGASAIGWAIDALAQDPSATVTIVVAQHHLHGARTFERYDLCREDEEIRSGQGVGSYKLSTLRYGTAQAAAELAYHIACIARGHSAHAFRQPPKE